MCAINGIAGKTHATDADAIVRMNVATAHRGPDGSRVFSGEGVFLGFNRLAIIDLSEKAMQPMTDVSGRYTIVFNGEIYNYRELKNELAEYPFQTESDTEVILAAYSRWEGAAFSRLNGMFAIAIWDSQLQRLTVARDSVGVKPLYYAFENNRLVFSSEIKALIESGVSTVLNRESLGHYLRLMYVPAPETMFQGIKKMLPGHTLILQNDTLTIEPFRGRWPDAEPVGSFADAKHKTRVVVESAVRRQLVSDRPIGVYLSGGIDSSVVLASAAKTHPAIDTFSVGFQLETGEEAEKFNADALLARETARTFGARHHEFLLSSADVLDLFRDAVRHMDEPIGNATSLAQLYLARQTKPTATVVLTGDGGDELFGGYERYRMSLIAEKYGRLIPEFVRKNIPRLEHAHLSGVDRFAQLMFQKDTELSRMLTSSALLPDTRALFDDEFRAGESIVSALMRADEKHWLIDEALMRSDKMSMGASVEARVPLLDLEVRALAHAIPESYKVTPFSTKRVLKEAFRDVLPESILSAPKRGWFSPGAKWLRHPNFVAYADEVFTPSYAPAVAELFNFPEIRKMWEDHRVKRSYHYTSLFAVLTFLEWAREYKISI